MKVFVTGGTGLIGEAVVRELRSAGHRVLALARSPESATRLESVGAEAILGELGDLASWRAAASEAEAAVHAAFDMSGGGLRKDRAAVDGLLEIAAAAPTYTVVYTSGIWVLGACDGADESSPVAPAELVTWRPPIEEAVLTAATSTVSTAVVRPGVVYGGHSGLIGQHFEAALAEGVTRFIGDGSNRVPIVHREDAAVLYRRIVEAGARGVFHATDDGQLTSAEVAALAGRAAGTDGRTESIPLEDARRDFGPVADALVLDQVVLSRRSHEFGWSTSRRDLAVGIDAAFEEWSALRDSAARSES